MARKNKSGLPYLGLALLAVATFTVVRLAFAVPPPPKKTAVDTPILTCAGASTSFIDVRVCAPAEADATGFPAGFSLQWVKCEDLAAGVDGIPDTADDGIWSNLLPSYCGASFSGNAKDSRYALAPGDCVTIRIGDLLFDNGTSVDEGCGVALECGTCYAIRGFAHATSSLKRSEFTGTLTCVTDICGAPAGCTLTQGFWKTHGPEGCVKGNNFNTWPVAGLSLGNVNYTDLQICSIFNQPPAGNGLVSLAHQLAAAKLNVANGSDTAIADNPLCGSAGGYTDITQVIAAADALIGNLVVPPVGSGSLPSSTTSTLVTILNNYNTGCIGPGHCDDLEP